MSSRVRMEPRSDPTFVSLRPVTLDANNAGLYANRAACHFKLGDAGACAADCNKVCFADRDGNGRRVFKDVVAHPVPIAHFLFLSSGPLASDAALHSQRHAAAQAPCAPRGGIGGH